MWILRRYLRGTFFTREVFCISCEEKNPLRFPLLCGFFHFFVHPSGPRLELELELIQTQMAQKPMLRAEVGMRVRCANKASAE